MNLSIQREKSKRQEARITGHRNRGRLFRVFRVLESEKGIALVMALVLSAILLVIMAALLYMLLAGTQVSGLQKRYKTAYEAGVGGADFVYQFIAARGDPGIPSNTFFSSSIVMTSACMTDKLTKATADWALACNKSLTIDPLVNTSYDMTVDLLGSSTESTTYRVYSKIVDTVVGNSGGDLGLSKGGVVNTGDIAVMSVPYLYTIEIDSENPANPSERAKLSILYQY